MKYVLAIIAALFVGFVTFKAYGQELPEPSQIVAIPGKAYPVCETMEAYIAASQAQAAGTEGPYDNCFLYTFNTFTPLTITPQEWVDVLKDDYMYLLSKVSWEGFEYWAITGKVAK